MEQDSPVIKARLFNVVLLVGGFPDQLLASRNVFIPKKKEPKSPSEYRPISISSVAVRQLHRILAHRVSQAALVDERQKAFISADGTAENTVALSACLWSAKFRLKEVHFATLDLAKAFNTTSHNALHGIIAGLGLPRRFVKYVMGMYERAYIHLEVRGATSGPVPVRRGVRQGDPLSPVLFNLAVNNILAAIPKEVGFNLDGHTINALAFADVMVGDAVNPHPGRTRG